jgi:hypothetical protein
MKILFFSRTELLAQAPGDREPLKHQRNEDGDLLPASKHC